MGLVDDTCLVDLLESTGIKGRIKAIAPWIPTEAMAAMPAGWLKISVKIKLRVNCN